MRPWVGSLGAALVFGAAFFAGRLVVAPAPAQACSCGPCEDNGERLVLQVASVTVDGVERPEARGFGSEALAAHGAREPRALHLSTGFYGGRVFQQPAYAGEASGWLYDPDLQAAREVELVGAP